MSQQTIPAKQHHVDIIHQIVLRAERDGLCVSGHTTDDYVMDLIVCHEDNPLDFEKLLNFSNFDFVHDMLGIAIHLDHYTFKLQHLFLPRSSVPSNQKFTEKPDCTYVTRKQRVDSMMAEMAGK
jgi:hypothetical protein